MWPEGPCRSLYKGAAPERNLARLPDNARLLPKNARRASGRSTSNMDAATCRPHNRPAADNAPLAKPNCRRAWGRRSAVDDVTGGGSCHDRGRTGWRQRRHGLCGSGCRDAGQQSET